jgi:hypothetical protein
MSESSGATREPVRLNVNLDAETATALKGLAETHGISLTEIVRRAISVYRYFDTETRSGRRIQTINRNGTDVKELVLL